MKTIFGTYSTHVKLRYKKFRTSCGPYFEIFIARRSIWISVSLGLGGGSPPDPKILKNCDFSNFFVRLRYVQRWKRTASQMFLSGQKGLFATLTLRTKFSIFHYFGGPGPYVEPIGGLVPRNVEKMMKNWKYCSQRWSSDQTLLTT